MITPEPVAPLTDNPRGGCDTPSLGSTNSPEGGEANHLETESAIQRRQLEEAGWEPVEDGEGPIVWRNPKSGRLYPQEVAVELVRKGTLQPPPSTQDDPDAVS